MTKLLNHINTYQSEADYQNDKSKNFPNVSYIIENDNVLFEVYRYEKQYFAIESLEDDNAIMFKLSSESGSPSASSAKTISVSTDDGVTWTDYTSTADGTTIATLNIGQKILIKGNNDTYNVVSDYIGNFSCFTASKQIDVNGNIMSLIYGDNFKGQYSFPSGTFNFYNIFNSAPIVSAENLILPATTLATACYKNMFKGCTGLTTAPALPATTLASNCYSRMFQYCTNLTSAPVLPATILASGCYESMFFGCTSLKTAPSVLPATILASSCYNGMFQGCTSLKTAPTLPATTLESWCCKSMFQGCTKLSYIKCLATDISATNCTLDWVDGVASTGTFVKDANMTSWTTGISGIPTGWDVVTE